MATATATATGDPAAPRTPGTRSEHPGPRRPVGGGAPGAGRRPGEFTRLEIAHADDKALIADLTVTLQRMTGQRRGGKKDTDDEGYKPIPAPRWWQLQGRERADAITRLRAWVETVFRPGYGHLAKPGRPVLGAARPVPVPLAGCRRCTPSLPGAGAPAGQPGGLAHPAPARRRRADGGRDRSLRPPAPRTPVISPAPTRGRARHERRAERSPQEAAQAYAAIGWPVFPCRPDRRSRRHATGSMTRPTDERQIADWWRREPAGTWRSPPAHPGPDVVDVDLREDGTGSPRSTRPSGPGWSTATTRSSALRPTGFHLYSAGSDQRNGSSAASPRLPLEGRLRRRATEPRRRRAYVVAKHAPAAGATVSWDAIRACSSRRRRRNAPRSAIPAGDIGAPVWTGWLNWVAPDGPGPEFPAVLGSQASGT